MNKAAKREALLKTIGASVAKRRNELVLSQGELAARAGVHRTYISDVERGTRNVSILTLHRIAEALDVPIGVLLFLGDQPVPKANKR